MNQKRILFKAILILAVVILLGWWLGFSKKTPASEKPTGKNPIAQSPSSSPVSAPMPSIEERRKAVVEKIQSMFATPITFYGKVIDQNGDPVAGATVKYNVNDKFNAPGSKYTGESDANGFFSISGIKGAVLLAGVNKEGYYHIDGKSADAFAYGIGPDSNSKPPPTKENPAIFVLHKMGETEPLIRIESRSYRIQKNGTPVKLNLETGRVNPQGDIQVEVWTEDDKRNEKRQYNWRCRLSVPDGGLVERKGQFEFEAPENGYQPSDEIVMRAESQNWQPRVKRNYFVKLNDGRYARIHFDMIAGGDHFFELESYLNPKPGSRNLEFDPAKTVKARSL